MHRVLPLLILGLFAASSSWTAPLPYTDVIRIGPPPICPGSEIPFFIAGKLPGNCYQFRGLELRPSPIMGPMPEPPIARVYVAINDCMEFPCNDLPIPWEASTMLPGLPSRNYNMIVELAEVGWCDPTRTPIALYTTIVPFQVGEPCPVEPAGVAPTTSRFELSAARPNPFAGETRLVLSLLEAVDADVAVFDLVGRRVATLHQGPLTTGDHVFRWDGRHTDGTRAREGVYFCRVLGAGASTTRRLILLGGR